MAARDLNLDRPEPGEAPGPATVHLAPMRRRHLRAVLRIEAQVYPRPWSVGLFMSELALRSARAYQVAKVGGTVVGYSGLMFSGDEAHVTTVAVDPAWHRRKVGTRLLLNMARLARARQCRVLTLEVRVSNLGAQALYREFGFVPVGIRRNYYTETNEDAIIMTAEDICSPAYERRLARIEEAVGGLTIVERSRW